MCTRNDWIHSQAVAFIKSNDSVTEMNDKLTKLPQIGTKYPLIIFLFNPFNHETINGSRIKINQQIYLVHVNTWNVYEKYTINNVEMVQKLGFFKNPDMDFHIPRLNFQGIELKGSYYNYIQVWGGGLFRKSQLYTGYPKTHGSLNQGTTAQPTYHLQ
jgi:hypothetical protein